MGVREIERSLEWWELGRRPRATCAWGPGRRCRKGSAASWPVWPTVKTRSDAAATQFSNQGPRHSNWTPGLPLMHFPPWLWFSTGKKMHGGFPIANRALSNFGTLPNTRAGPLKLPPCPFHPCPPPFRVPNYRHLNQFPLALGPSLRLPTSPWSVTTSRPCIPAELVGSTSTNGPSKSSSANTSLALQFPGNRQSIVDRQYFLRAEPEGPSR